MEVTKPLIGQALQENRRLVVPIYQRAYAWKDDLVEGLWKDVKSRAMLIFANRELPAHFMGAIILAPPSSSALMGGTPDALVVDGQQRLTTFQLFIGALRQVAEENDEVGLAESLKPYFYNHDWSENASSKRPLKLVPTADDRAIFDKLMRLSWDAIRDAYPDCFYKKGTLIDRSSPLSLRAFYLFRQQIADFIDPPASNEKDDAQPDREEPESYLTATLAERLDSLAKGLLNQQRLVVISLAPEDDAQIIFESLNSKRKPLLAMELVRNNIFHRATPREEVEYLYDTYWTRFRGSFWTDNSPRAKPLRPRIDHYLAHTLTALSGTETALRNLYNEYLSFVASSRFTSVEDELQALTCFTKTYTALESGDDNALGWLGNKLAIWQVTTATPAIFLIANADIDDSQKDELYRLIYSYIVRRAICGEGTKNMNKVFERVCTAFLENGVSTQSFRDVFSRTTAKNVYFPDNGQFIRAIETNPIYAWIGRKDRIRDFLWELECRMRTKFQVTSDQPDSISIEHIMPKEWSAHWPLSNVDTPERLQHATEKRDACLDRIGNLTLVTVPLNSSMQNAEWDVKKPRLTDSLLALNTPLANEADWNENTIALRGSTLAKYATEIWPALR